MQSWPGLDLNPTLDVFCNQQQKQPERLQPRLGLLQWKRRGLLSPNTWALAPGPSFYLCEALFSHLQNGGWEHSLCNTAGRIAKPPAWCPEPAGLCKGHLASPSEGLSAPWRLRSFRILSLIKAGNDATFDSKQEVRNGDGFIRGK